MVVTNQSQVSQLLMGYHTDHNCFPRCRISAFIRISQNHLNLLLQPAISSSLNRKYRLKTTITDKWNTKKKELTASYKLYFFQANAKKLDL